jgi:hypothetical protein
MRYNPFNPPKIMVYPTDPAVRPFELRGVTQINGPTRAAEMTDLPIEQGVNISTHRRLGPRAVSFTILLANITTISDPLAFQSEGDIVAAQRLPLIELYQRGILCTLSWGDVRLPSMAVLSLDESHDPAQHLPDTWEASISWRETYVASSTTTPSSVSSDIADEVASTQEGGPQADTALGPETSAQIDGTLAAGF